MGRIFKVGIFDSGIGGLTVLSECVKLMPENQYFYLGDNFRAPYGSRPPQEIAACVREALVRFREMNADAAVLACNTATAVCAEKMRSEFSFPIVGTEPAVKPASERCGRVLVLATPRTTESERLRKLVARYHDTCNITVFALEGLAAAVESAVVRGKALDLREHLPQGNYDGIVLGCTHYVYFKKEIAAFYSAPVFDGGEGTARQLRSVLGKQRNIEFSENLGIDDHFSDSLTAEGYNANNCSEKMPKNEGISSNSGIIFIGNAKNINKIVYEQMFIS